MKLIPATYIPTVSFRDDFRIKEFILDQNQGVDVVTSEIDYGLTGKYEFGYVLAQSYCPKILRS